MKRVLLMLLSLNAISAHQYKSQFGQDGFFNENYFHDKKDGVFLDLGVHDGVSFSNTWFYEKVLG